MILLFEKNEKSFSTLGIGVLKDAISCIVIEELNGGFELEMEYPVTGAKYNDISLEKLILAKPNTSDQPQPFRIYSITKPFNGRVIIKAEHISYDMSGYIVKAFEATDSYDAMTKIQNGAFPDSPFMLSTDKFVTTSMKTDKPYSQRALLAGQSGSLLDIYRGEYRFDRFNVHLLNNRGQDRGVTIRYGKNLTDLEDEISSSKSYTGVFPFYSAIVNETTTETENFYESGYIVEESVTFAGNWLSSSEGGKAIIPIMENTPIQVKTPGIYFDKVCYFLRATSSENLFQCYIRTSGTPFSHDWLSLTSDGPSITPTERTIFKVLTEGDFLNKHYIWDGVSYVEFLGTGFYYIYSEDNVPPPNRSQVIPKTEERHVYIDLTEYPELTNGILHVDGQESTSPQRILNLDLTDRFDTEPTTEQLKAKAEDYLQNNNLQKQQNSLTISFVKLSDTEEYKHFRDLEVVNLGDYVYVYYEKLNVDSKLQVISTEFNVLSEKYNEIQLGTKTATLTDTAITAGDSVSSLTNDANYTDKISVVNLFADNLTAEYITGKNAKLSEAQIKDLETDRIKITGALEASQGTLDLLISQMLVAEDAEIKNKLVSGEIEVKGKITATSGEIKTEIKVGDDGDGGYNFSVDKYGKVTAKSGEIGNCKIDENGNLIISTSIEVGESETPNDYNFSVDKYGNVIANSFTFKEGELSIQNGVFTTDNIEFVNGAKISSEPAGEDYDYQTVNIHTITAQRSQSLPSRFCDVSMGLSFHNKDGTEIVGGTTKTLTSVILNIQQIDSFSGRGYIRQKDVTIPSGTGAAYSTVIEMSYGYDTYNFVGTLPITKKETVSGSPGVIMINSDLLPETNGDLSIGSDDKKWHKMISAYNNTDEMDVDILRISDIFSFNSNKQAYFGTGGIGTNGPISLGGNLETLGLGAYDIGNSYFKWRNIYATNGVIQTSDNKEKKDKSYDINKYDTFFDRIKPSLFKMIDGTSGRTHLGLISQDIEEALLSVGLTSKDFAGFIKTLKPDSVDKPQEELNDDDYNYGLRYDEFHALEIYEIQKLKKEVKKLKQELQEIKDLIKNKEE